MGDSSEASTDASTHEVEVVIPVPAMSSGAWAVAWIAAVSAGAIYAAVAYPIVAVRYFLPLAAFFVTPFVRILCARPSPHRLSFDARGIRTDLPGVIGRTEWADVTRIVDAPNMLLIETVEGAAFRIPWSAKPDLRAILALAPKSATFQDRASTAPRNGGRKTLLLWLILIVVMSAIYSLLAQDPH